MRYCKLCLNTVQTLLKDITNWKTNTLNSPIVFKVYYLSIGILCNVNLKVENKYKSPAIKYTTFLKARTNAYNGGTV